LGRANTFAARNETSFYLERRFTLWEGERSQLAESGVPIINTLVNALSVLEVLARSDREWIGISELANQLRLNKSTVLRILATFEMQGYVEQDPKSKEFRLTLKLFELGSNALARTDLLREARPFLKKLEAATGETVHLAVLDDGEAVYVDKVEGEQAIQMYSRIGRRSPVHCTGVGKVLLAFRPDEEVAAIVARRGLRKFTANTITSMSRLLEELATIRQQGVAFDDEEHEEGIRCVAAPIYDHRGEVIASLSLTVPAFRMSREKAREMVGLVKGTADAISSRLGRVSNQQATGGGFSNAAGHQ